MAKKTEPQNGHNRLEDAMALLIQNQATLTQTQAMFNQNQAALLGRLAETERATSERFGRIEAELAAIRHVLLDHSRLLERLPEAVKEKIGFKG